MLRVGGLNLQINGTPILHDLALSLQPGRILGIVGESGSGKSMTALAMMGLLPDGSQVQGNIGFQDRNLVDANEDEMLTLRGHEIGMIFQEPMTALNPVHTIGDQVCEAIAQSRNAGRTELEKEASEVFETIDLPTARFPLSRYPHELSGGQRQRVVIAIAIAQNPALLIADEPTTALDVTLQARILNMLRSIVDHEQMGLILISHDLAVVAEVTDDIIVMREGRVVDAGPTGEVLRSLSHPYTKQLALASSHIPNRSIPPVLTHESEQAHLAPLVHAKDVVRDYPTPRRSLFEPGTPFRAVDQVSLALYPGQSMGLVGESGCGKSTLARMLLALDRPTVGTIRFQDTELTTADTDALRQARRNMQVVFQDPFASFNPRHKVERLVAEPLYLEDHLSREEKRERVIAALAEVDMKASAVDKYPHEFSGGQRQRLAIARALITRPALIVADEPVSALDVSIRAQVLDLFADLRERLGLTYLFISHDLGVVRAICDEVLVMEAGKIVERGPAPDIFDNPQSNAAIRLVEATPNLERALANRLDVRTT